MSKNQDSCLRTRKETDLLRAELNYEQTVPAVFLRRLNRFVAEVEAGGKTERVHVKNTGRLGELLLPGQKLPCRRQTRRAGRPPMILYPYTNNVS